MNLDIYLLLLFLNTIRLFWMVQFQFCTILGYFVVTFFCVNAHLRHTYNAHLRHAYICMYIATLGSINKLFHIGPFLYTDVLT